MAIDLQYAAVMSKPKTYYDGSLAPITSGGEKFNADFCVGENKNSEPFVSHYKQIAAASGNFDRNDGKHGLRCS
jgi:hypothetical protein